jgi:hypothetical protein
MYFLSDDFDENMRGKAEGRERFVALEDIV